MNSVNSTIGEPDDTEACVALWLLALHARDGRRAVDGTAERVRSKFATARLSWRVLRDAAAPASAPILGFGLMTQPGTGNADDPADAAYFSLLAVAPDAQGRGFGALLLGELIDDARAAGHRSAVLHTIVGSPAEALYRSRGWLPHGNSFAHPLNGLTTQTYLLQLPARSQDHGSS